MNLQDAFLNQVRIQKVPVILYLIGGHQMRGTVRGFDNFVIVFDVGGKQNLIYKHSISTITPLSPISIYNNAEETAETVSRAEDEPNEQTV